LMQPPATAGYEAISHSASCILLGKTMPRRLKESGLAVFDDFRQANDP
jgi:hypothetical protein